MDRFDPLATVSMPTAFPALPTLADVAERVAAAPGLAADRRRDLLSALRRVPDLAGRDPATIPAEAATIRRLFEGVSPAAWGVSDKTFANLRSNLVAAVRHFRPGPRHLTHRVPLAPAWATLLESVPVEHVRQGLYRLASYCTLAGIAPEGVDSGTLLALHAAVAAEELVKSPRTIVKLTITSWNRCARTVPGWPAVRLSSPFAREAYMLPLTDLPAPFQADVRAWQERLRHPDPLAEDAAPRALREPTIKGYETVIRLFASALLRGGAVELSTLAGLADLFDGDRFRQAPQVLLARRHNKTGAALANGAGKMVHLARHHCRLDEARLAGLRALVNRLRTGSSRTSSANVRKRVQAFDDPELKRRFLALPDELLRRADALRNAKRAAHAVEQALMLHLMLSGLRQNSLRQLRLDHLRPLPDGRRMIHVPAAIEKTAREREIELEGPAAATLDRYLAHHRTAKASADSPWLFAGDRGQPRSKTAVNAALSHALQQVGGLDLHPHGIRHVLGKIVVERDPGALYAVSKVLGHQGLDTTMQSYLCTEGKAAARRVDALVEAARAESRDRASRSGRGRTGSKRQSQS